MPGEPKQVQPRPEHGSDQGKCGEGRRVGPTHGASSPGIPRLRLMPLEVSLRGQVFSRLKRPLSKMVIPETWSRSPPTRCRGR